MFAFRNIKEPYHVGEYPKETFCAHLCHKCLGNYVTDVHCTWH